MIHLLFIMMGLSSPYTGDRRVKEELRVLKKRIDISSDWFRLRMSQFKACLVDWGCWSPQFDEFYEGNPLTRWTNYKGCDSCANKRETTIKWDLEVRLTQASTLIRLMYLVLDKRVKDTLAMENNILAMEKNNNIHLLVDVVEGILKEEEEGASPEEEEEESPEEGAPEEAEEPPMKKRRTE